jgi:dihydroorotate dehydrogenase
MHLPHWHGLTSGAIAQINRDWEQPLPADPGAYIAERYGLDITGRYAGRAIKNPFGKASGQLSLHIKQVQADAEAHLGFVVLKTVIAEDETGAQMMKAWAIKETRMLVEPIAGKTMPALGWTVSWKGRGWHESFDSYLTFVRQAVALGLEHGMPVAPSVKYHLPGPGEADFRVAEYTHTTRTLLNAWRGAGENGPMLLEKDFSPTLAGDDLSRQRDLIVTWLTKVPGLIRGAVAPGEVVLGMKVMNAMFDDAFQVELLRAAALGSDYLVCFNRLFDPAREFEGKVGVAYGGPDLSARNLRVLKQARLAGLRLPEISGTGDVCSGKMALKYALLGAESLQMHTFFQLPDPYYANNNASKPARAMHRLLFHPADGLVPWMLYLKDRTGISRFLEAKSAPLEALV